MRTRHLFVPVLAGSSAFVLAGCFLSKPPPGGGGDGGVVNLCGDGIVEPGEVCDGNCPTSCDDGNPCTTDTMTGSAATCDAVCSHVPVTACIDGDGCCPPGCLGHDAECDLTPCGDGLVVPPETCDGNCPTSCDDGNACTTDTMTGSAATCDVQCQNIAVTACVSGDGCCPPGCNATNDSDC